MAEIVLNHRIGLDPAIFRLSAPAFRQLIQMLCYFAEYSPDDWLIPTRLARIGLARELEQAGLIRADGGVYRAESGLRELARIVPTGPNRAKGSKILGSGSRVEDLEPSPTKKLALQDLERGSFERFWDVFGLKTGRPKAEQAWLKAIRKTDPEAIIEGARAYREWLDGHPDPPKQKYAQGWLNDRRWEDELPPYPSSNGRSRRAGLTTEELLRRAAAAAQAEGGEG